jgi:hypothetical protein
MRPPLRFSQYLSHRVPILSRRVDSLVEDDCDDVTKQRRMKIILLELRSQRKYFNAEDVDLETLGIYQDLKKRVERHYRKYRSVSLKSRRSRLRGMRLSVGITRRKTCDGASTSTSARANSQYGSVNETDSGMSSYSSSESTDRGSDRGSTGVATMEATPTPPCEGCRQAEGDFRQIRDLLGLAMQAEREPSYIVVRTIDCNPQEECDICSEKVNQILQFQCNHRTCSPCLNKLREKICPHCRASLSV